MKSLQRYLNGATEFFTANGFEPTYLNLDIDDGCARLEFYDKVTACVEIDETGAATVIVRTNGKSEICKTQWDANKDKILLLFKQKS